MKARAFAAGLSALLLCGAAEAWTVAADDPLQLSEVAACRGRPDRALCILRVVTRHDQGAAVLADRDLAARPDILARVGADARAVAAREAELENWTQELRGQFVEMFGPTGSGGDIGELRRLIRARKLDEAAALSDRATTTAWVEERLNLAPNRQARFRSLRRSSQARAELRLKPLIREARRAGDLERVKELEWGLAMAAMIPLPEVPSRAQAEAEAEAELMDARAGLVWAASDARPDLARRVADQLLTAKVAAGPAHEHLVWKVVMDDAARLARYATPAVARAWVERLEARIGPPAAGPRSDRLEVDDAIGTAAAIWTHLGLPERLDALLSRWTPVAAAQAAAARAAGRADAPVDIASAIARARVHQGRRAEAEALGVLSPSDWLMLDAFSERMHRHLGEHLGQAKTRRDRRGVLDWCAKSRGEETVARRCLDTLAAEAADLDEKRDAARALLAFGAARTSDRLTASQMLTRALDVGAGLPDKPGRLTGLYAEREYLVALAKAELMAAR